MRTLSLILVTAAIAAPLSAQAPDSAAIKLKQRVDAIFGIPQKADDARKAGVPDSTVQSIMKILGKEKVPAADAGIILTAERDGAREGGSKDNLGAFVQRQHAAGLRGRELADAIHAEQERRGMRKKGAEGEREMEDHDAMDRDRKPDADMSKGRKPDDAKGKGKKPDDAGSKGKSKRPDQAASGRRPLPG
ncbi:MAG: hypothetical protein OEW77_01895 [Gemmatimonadota bacterium]|nr:hypothetical protein [Gemmatimonadota bacterium]